jgi:hypothetical protein
MRLASCLQQQNAKTAILCEAVGERRARRSGANDDEIDGALVHSNKSSDHFRRDLRQRHHRGRRLSRGELPIADMGLCARHEQIPASRKAFDLIGEANVAALRIAGVGQSNVGQAAPQVEISAIVLSGNCLVNALAACARSKFYVRNVSKADVAA